MQNNNRILIPVLLGLAILIILMGIKPLYTEYLDNQTALHTAQNLEASREKTLATLEAFQKSFSSGSTTELTEKVKKVSSPWDEASIMSAVMLNDYTKGTEYTAAPIILSSVGLDKGKRLPSGLSLGTVTLTINSTSVENVIDFLTYLTTTAPYVFTLDSITLPLSAPVQKETNGVSLQITLGVYYYE